MGKSSFLFKNMKTIQMSIYFQNLIAEDKNVVWKMKTKQSDA